MGRFSHEAVDIDPGVSFDGHRGVAYLTEDDFEGLIDDDDPNQDTRRSYLYRFVPDDPGRRPGALQEGGTLEVAKLDEAPNDADFIDLGQRFTVRWIAVNPEDPRTDALSVDATRFNRLEGAYLQGRGVLVRRHGRRRGSARPDLSLHSRRPTPSSSTTRARTRTAWRARTTSPSRRGETCGWPRTATSATASSASRPEGDSYVFAHNRVPFQSSPGMPAGRPGASAPSSPAPPSRPTARRSSSTSRAPASPTRSGDRSSRPAPPASARWPTPTPRRRLAPARLRRARRGRPEARHEHPRSRRLRPSRRTGGLDDPGAAQNGLEGPAPVRVPPSRGRRPRPTRYASHSQLERPGGKARCADDT